MRRFILVLLAAGLVAPVHAAEYGGAGNDGNSLLEACQLVLDADLPGTSPETLLDAGRKIGYCTGLLKGVGRTLMIMGALCPPETSSGGQWVRVVVKSLEERPAMLHESDVALTMSALHGAWPCEAPE